ncbi:hypothetical protein HPB47_011700 [Ixodes persulcatus]|uniref:Uncharacterized protein n=1 Tax=Ixodes persulcatus TaxID=34615 RepID=A0AC60NVL0_IXOPE|nr:hypothetical protein HPB47_011700 [Ixodes persulcatus]
MSLAVPPPFLPVPGNPVLPWKQGDAHEPAQRKALLLHCLGVESQQIFYILLETHLPVPGLREPPEGQKTSTAPDGYDVTLAVREIYLAVTSNRAQLPGEFIDAFVAELRDMLSNCEFGFMVDEFIRDQLVAKKSVNPLAKRKAAPGGTCLTLDRALVIGCLVEETVRYCKDLISASALQKVDAKLTRSAEKPPRPREVPPAALTEAAPPEKLPA